MNVAAHYREMHCRLVAHFVLPCSSPSSRSCRSRRAHRSPLRSTTTRERAPTCTKPFLRRATSTQTNSANCSRFTWTATSTPSRCIFRTLRFPAKEHTTWCSSPLSTTACMRSTPTHHRRLRSGARRFVRLRQSDRAAHTGGRRLPVHRADHRNHVDAGDRRRRGNHLRSRAHAASTASYFQKLHALDVTTGAEKPGSPVTIQASAPHKTLGLVSNPVDFDPVRENPRAALLLSNGTVYLSWASSCDVGPYHGWMIAYDARTLAANGRVQHLAR